MVKKQQMRCMAPERYATIVLQQDRQGQRARPERAEQQFAVLIEQGQNSLRGTVRRPLAVSDGSMTCPCPVRDAPTRGYWCEASLLAWNAAIPSLIVGKVRVGDSPPMT